MIHITLTVLNLLGGLAIFLFGMKIMSDGLQKFAGVKMRQLLHTATSNRVAATLSGMLVTAIIQSSSATTVMVVGFTSAGLLTLYQALGVIFGANIGTTLTAWVVSLFGFKIQISLFALPVIALGFFGQFLPVKWVRIRRLAEAAVGFGLLFLGLDILKNSIPPDLAQHPAISQLLASLNPNTAGHLILLILSGAFLTVILQSSSAVMAMTLTLAAAGVLNFPTACALVLGENIGTTVTANLAAAQASRNARRAALGHFLFNLFGVIWVSLIFPYFIAWIDRMVPGNPTVSDPHTLTSILPYHIAAFHSVFNILNTLFMLPLLKPLAWLTLRLLPKTRREEQEQDQALVYLNTHLTQTPELALLAACQETKRMMDFVLRISDKLVYAIKTDTSELFTRLLADIKNYEHTTDVLEHKINLYLTQMTHGNLSRHAIVKTVRLFDFTGSIESMADCAEKIALDLEKQKSDFQTLDKQGLETIAKKTKQILRRCRTGLEFFPNLAQADKPTAVRLWQQALADEAELNSLRNDLQQQRNQRISEQKNTFAPISIATYGNILNSFERMGDYALRIMEEALRAGNSRLSS